ncbi:MAG: hypothetical protein E6J90_16465 [Deltaproteobacteria bacterium]|nr:MAG: hypothetical protein E6J90_16465 [Deltaproteobacteria bacterium]
MVAGPERFIPERHVVGVRLPGEVGIRLRDAVGVQDEVVARREALDQRGLDLEPLIFLGELDRDLRA